MARHVDMDPREVVGAEQLDEKRVREHFTRYFGWRPESVRSATRGSPLHGVIYIVKLRFGIGCPVEFMATSDGLIGIPPKKKWKN